MTYSRLLSAGEEATAAELLAEVRPRERAPEGRPFVFVNMVSTVDGRAQRSGSTRALGEAADLEMLLELRTLADAVLIGTGTLRVEGYARLMTDAAIVRNRLKIDAAIANAKAVAAMERDGESLGELLWSFAPPERPAPRTMADVPAVTPESTAMAKELKRRGFRFVGPTTAYALMQACGIVNDHIDGCLAR